MRRLFNPCVDYGAATMHKNASPSPRRFAQRKIRFSTRRQMRILIRAYFTSFRCLERLPPLGLGEVPMAATPWLLVDIFKIRRLTCHCVITISAVLFKFGSKQRSVVDLPSMGIASTVALRPNGMSLAARSCWGSEFAKGLLRAGVFEPPVWGSRGLIGIDRLCSLCRSMCNHAPLMWKHWSATGPHVKRTVDQGQVSGEPKFDGMPLG